MLCSSLRAAAATERSARVIFGGIAIIVFGAELSPKWFVVTTKVRCTDLRADAI